MLRLASSLVALTAVAHLASAQTAAQISTEQMTLATVIPSSCSTQCAAWLAALGRCPGATSAAYSTCVCDPTFVSNFDTCAACLATDLTTGGNAANAATASSAPADLTGYCAAAGTVVATSSSSALVATSTTALTPVVVAGTSSPTSRTYTVKIPSVTTPIVTYTTTSSISLAPGETPESTPPAVVTLKLTAADQPFPTQSKGASVFASGAEGRTVGATLLALGAVAGAMLLA